MSLDKFLGAAAGIDTAWSIAAFAIAALLAVLQMTVGTTAAKRRGRKPASPILTGSIIWPLVVAICVLAAMPILADVYSQQLRANAIYQVRVTTLDEQGNPVGGARLRTTASNETTTTSQDTAVVAIPRAAVPADGRVTIYADRESAFQFGRAEVQLGGDLNPSVTITLASRRDATITGLVQDAAGRAVAGATVTVLGGESGATSERGTFALKTNAAEGQIVRVHAEKPGYAAVDQDHPAGKSPMTIVLPLDKERNTRPGPRTP